MWLPSNNENVSLLDYFASRIDVPYEFFNVPNTSTAIEFTVFLSKTFSVPLPADYQNMSPENRSKFLATVRAEYRYREAEAMMKARERYIKQN